MNVPEISRHWARYQPLMFRELEVELEAMTGKHKELIYALDVLRFERFLHDGSMSSMGRPPVSRLALARAFTAKAILNLATTRALIDRLQVDAVLRRICGFESRREIPSEGTFSNAFAEFATAGLPSTIHSSLITAAFTGKLVGHVSRDATSINGREKPIKKQKKPKNTKKRGRPKKGEEPPPPDQTRLERQLSQSLPEMVNELATACDVSGKKNSKGNTEWWIGYKFHFDVEDNGIPLSCLLTSASVHDSQVAIPLEIMTADRVTSLYSVMDKGYFAAPIQNFIEGIGKVPLIDPKKPRGGEVIPLSPAEAQRFKIRTTVERANSELKDNHGGRTVRVRGHAKVLAHLMFGILAMTAEGLMRHFV
jgi:hypothetical protein